MQISDTKKEYDINVTEKGNLEVSLENKQGFLRKTLHQSAKKQAERARVILRRSFDEQNVEISSEPIRHYERDPSPPVPLRQRS